MTSVQGHRFTALEVTALEEEQSAAAFPADCSSADATTTPTHAASPKARPLPANNGATEGPLTPPARAPSRPRKPKPPKAKPHTRCRLCDRVGRAETFIRSGSTGKHYCVDFDKCDRKRGAIKSRRAH